jgi:hypothetical protein
VERKKPPFAPAEQEEKEKPPDCSAWQSQKERIRKDSTPKHRQNQTNYTPKIQ